MSGIKGVDRPHAGQFSLYMPEAEKLREAGREEIRALIREADGKGSITGEARTELEKAGTLKQK